MLIRNVLGIIEAGPKLGDFELHLLHFFELARCDPDRLLLLEHPRAEACHQGHPSLLLLLSRAVHPPLSCFSPCEYDRMSYACLLLLACYTNASSLGTRTRREKVMPHKGQRPTMSRGAASDIASHKCVV